MNLHNQIMSLSHQSNYGGGYDPAVRAYRVGHKKARHDAAALALKYDAVVKQALQLLPEIIRELDYIDSDGWCRGDVHGDDLRRLSSLLATLKSL
jgi:hypothetical protein